MKLKNIILPLLIIGTLSCESNNSEDSTSITTDNTVVGETQVTENGDELLTDEVDSETIQLDTNEFGIPLNSEGMPMVAYEPLITDELYHVIANLDHPEMVEQGGYDETAAVIRYFKSDAFDIKVAYAQIVYIKGEVREPSYVFFYPDPNADELKLSSDTYSLQDKADYPCVICDLEEIRTEGDHIIGEFTDNITHEKFIKYMDYNFLEMYMSWTDKP